MSMFPTRGVFLCVVGSHFGEEDNGWASGSLGVAPMASGVGGRRRSIYPEGFHKGSWCKFSSTWVKVAA